MDESILKGYNQYIDVSDLSPEDIITIDDCDAAGTEAKTEVIRFHKWLITTMNYDLRPFEILHICDK